MICPISSFSAIYLLFHLRKVKFTTKNLKVPLGQKRVPVLKRCLKTTEQTIWGQETERISSALRKIQLLRQEINTGFLFVLVDI